ncbi:MAG: Rpn family recombination-promoting nuclease/putative transposase, partial [Parasporobacterium sp.]|nr:Rpn family recombination-promoting nuclease/putative transposase [Parasporobacterium sp.]
MKPEELENAAPLAVYNSKEGVRSMIHDVVKYWKKAECIIAVFGIENQSWIDPDQVFRDIGYLGTGYRDQLNRKDGKRYPIILITLYCGEKRWNTRRKLSDCFTIPEALKP